MSRNLLIFAILLVIITVIAYFAFANIKSHTSGKTADIHGHTIQLEIADTSTKQEKGLSERDSLPQDHGMLFTFSKPSRYSFWMKNMRFPIDIIFLNGNTVVTLFNNVQPQIGETNDANLLVYTAKAEANKVLEINAGLAQKYGLKEGDTITLNL